MANERSDSDWSLSDNDFDISQGSESDSVSEEYDVESDSDTDIGDYDHASVWTRAYPPEDISSGTKLVFTERHTGPISVPPRNSQPIQYLYLFLTDNVIGNIVKQTNKYAADVLATKTCT